MPEPCQSKAAMLFTVFPSFAMCSLPLVLLQQSGEFLHASLFPPPIMRWCPVAASTSRASLSVPQCLLSSGWGVKRSWPKKKRCLLAATCWSSTTSASQPTTPVWLCPRWAWSRQLRRSSSKVRVHLKLQNIYHLCLEEKASLCYSPKDITRKYSDNNSII